MAGEESNKIIPVSPLDMDPDLSSNRSSHNEETGGSHMAKDGNDDGTENIEDVGVTKDAPSTDTDKHLACDLKGDGNVEIIVEVVPDNDESKDDRENGELESVLDEDVEMSKEDMNMMYNAVKCGDIDLLDDLLDKPGADINMEWFSFNLLMVAIRAKQVDMALFLIDNGVHHNYETTRMEKCKSSPIIDWYTISCRQMAYESELWDVVDAIDEKNGDLWPNYTGKPRIIRYKKPLEVKLREQAELEELERLKELHEQADDIDGEEIDTISIDGADINKSVDYEDREESITSQCNMRNSLDSKQIGCMDEGDVISVIKSSSCDDEVSSGYSTLSSCDSQPDQPKASCVRTRALTPAGVRKTKSALARLTMSMCHLADQLQPDLPPVRPTSERGSYRRESKLWCASTPAFNAWTVDDDVCRDKNQPVTYRPWRSKRDKNISELNLCHRSECNLSGRRTKSFTHLPQESKTKAEISHIQVVRGHTMSMGCLINKKSAEAVSIHKVPSSSNSNSSLSISSISLDIPTSARPRSGSFKSRSLVEVTQRDARSVRQTPQLAYPRAVNLTSVLRHRGLNKQLSSRIELVLPDRKYSPAGHLRVRSAKGAR